MRNLTDDTGYQLAAAHRTLAGLRRSTLEPLGLTHAQYLALLALAQHRHPLTVTELAEELVLDAPTASPMLKLLDQAGRIRRERDPADRRRLMVTLTAAGREVLDQALDGVVQADVLFYGTEQSRALGL